MRIAFPALDVVQLPAASVGFIRGVESGMYRRKSALLTLLTLALLTGSASGLAALEYAGVNLSGAEFGSSSLPGTYNSDYIYPNQNEVDYFKSRGMNIIRLCFLWERLQRATNASLDPTELSRLNAFVSQATAKGVDVILDPHNYGRYYNQTIGSASVPYSAFSNFWWRVADVYRTNSRVVFGLMNEPHDMSTNVSFSTETWRDAAQQAINAIRLTGATNLILVPGNAYTGAQSWLQTWYGTPNGTAMLGITDPANHFAFEVHQYLDNDSSGTSATIANNDPMVGATRLAGFTQWCRNNHRKGFLGEFAVANSTIGAGIGDEAISNMLAHIESNPDVWLGWTWWSAGPWWGNYMFTLEPANNFTVDQPAMSVLRQFFPIPSPTLSLVGGSQFQFDTWPGFRYQPETSSNLGSGPWAGYGSEIIGSGSPVTLSLPVGSNPATVLRVRVYRAP
jgi:endoglucanase